jgi:hypothetical protein
MKYLVYFSILLSLVFQSCSEEHVKGKTWEGKLYRQSDEKELTDVKLKISNDSLYLFANAIFGAGNDTLILTEANEKDSIYSYRSIKGNVYTIVLKYVVTNAIETLYVTDVENDYFMILNLCPVDIRTVGALDFYKNRIVPRDSYLYLDGVYEGKLVWDNAFMGGLLSLYAGDIILRLTFLDDFKVKTCSKNALASLFGQALPCETVSYRIEGNKIFLIDNKKKKDINSINDEGIILDNGRTILFESHGGEHGGTIRLHKIH